MALMALMEATVLMEAIIAGKNIVDNNMARSKKDTELIEYIKRGLKEGFSKEEIKQKILEQGYPEKNVDKLMDECNKKKRILIYFGLFIFLVLVFTFVLIYTSKKPIITTNETLLSMEEARELSHKEMLVEAEHQLGICRANLQNRCLAVLNMNVSYCDKILPSNFTIGLESVEKQSMKEGCKRVIPLINYYSTKIIDDKCKNLPLNSKKSDYNMCKKVLICTEKGNEDYCDSEQCKDVYKLFKANKEKNISICENITDVIVKSDCKIIISSDLNYCSYDVCDENYERFVAEGNESVYSN